MPYTEVESFLLDPSDQFITLNLVKTEQERQRVFVFETSQKNIIGALVAAYRPALANWVRETADPSAPAKRRVKQVGQLLVYRAQSRTSNRTAWFRYPASLVRRFWEM